jgi:DNA-binding LacI/PurR family transcriptional regulator
MSTENLLGRPPERTERIVRELRERITQGLLAPGVQLPTRIEIEQHFSASSVTVQRALQELQRDGFVTVNGRQGTFVSETPPHLTNYALVFPTLPGESRWNRFFAALNSEAPALARGLGRRISVYYSADSHSDHEDYQRLLSDVKAHRLGGIIFASIPQLLIGTAILNEPAIPRVAIMSPSSQFEMSQINLDRESFWNRCADYLISKGRRNLSILIPPLKKPEYNTAIQKMTDRGFNVLPQWVQCVPREFPEAANNLSQLLFEHGRNRPDAFFITDDNFVEHALAGLIAAGAKVPDDVEIVAHCNFPYPVPAPVPVQRLGFDANHVLHTCFDDLDKQRSGKNIPSVTRIPAQFEYETNSVINI